MSSLLSSGAQTVSCGQQPVEDLANDVVTALAAGQDPASQVVVVCPSTDTSLSGTQAGLEAELDQLLAVQEALDAAELTHVVVYISQGKKQVEGQQQRRRVMAASAPPPAPSPPGAGRIVNEPLLGFGSYTTCGALCQVSMRGGPLTGCVRSAGRGGVGCCSGPAGRRGCSSQQACACLLAFGLLGNGEAHGLHLSSAPGSRGVGGSFFAFV